MKFYSVKVEEREKLGSYITAATNEE